MRKNRFYSIFLLLFFIFQNSYGQGKLNLELYGGPQKSFNYITVSPQSSGYSSYTHLDYHLGANFLYRIKGPWQLSVQAEYLRNSRKTVFYPNFPDVDPRFKGRSYDAFGNYSIGTRYTWEKEKFALFAQPSVGITLNNYSEMILNDSNYFVGFSPKQTAIVGNVRLEAGIKLYTPRKNYFVFGARFHQGIGQLNTLSFTIPVTNLNIEVERRGSYAGLFVGYGINFGNKSSREQFKANRPDRKPDRKDEKRDLAWKIGPYVMANGFLRFRPKSEREPNLEFSHISGGTNFVAGYRFNAFSVESGVARFNAQTYIAVPKLGISRNSQNNFLVNAIPLTVKYDFQVSDQNRLRFGPTFSAFYTLGTKGEGNLQGGVGGEQYNLSYQVRPSDPKGDLFFNAGIFAEVPIFNSSLLNFKVSQNFGSADVGFLDVTGEVNGQPVNFESSGTLNGFMLELGYKLPLNVLFKK